MRMALVSIVAKQDLRPIATTRRDAYPPLEAAARALVYAVVECAFHDARAVADQRVRAHDMRTYAKKRNELVEFFQNDAARLVDVANLDVDPETVQRCGLKILHTK